MSEHDLNHFTHLTFEDAYVKLEKLVEQLETNSLPLEESLSLFEEGQQLSAYCQQLLDKADLRVSKLIGNAGEIVSMLEQNGASKPEAEATPNNAEDKPEASEAINESPAESTTESSESTD